VNYPFGTAYQFRLSAQHREYYDQWAPTYDEDFAQQEGYDYPGRIAAIYRALAVGQDVPVADVGCGTGLLGRALVGAVPGLQVDGFDISPAMLAVALATGAYRHGVEVDLASPASPLPGGYGAVVSVGTFTLGHLGPDALRTILALGRPSALFVIGVNGKHFADAGFASVLDGLRESALITAWQSTWVPIFGEHATDDPIRLGAVVSFRLPA